ncbi:Qin prophage protein [Escherichia coli]|uniref:Qin prophage protein n=20 Tax=Enterobacterales TaxID=91347 RepID=A0A2X1NYA3_ECOLX|nr:Qin prophage protein [Escherichia coli]STM15789.1 Qin prophage protein [Escherichia coli]
MSLQVSHYNMLRASHEGSQKVVVRTVITVRFVPGAAIAKSILYCAGQLVFKESGHHLTGTDTIYFVTVRLHMHNSTYSSIFCFSMSVLLSRRRVSGDLNRPGFPGECFICELRLPDHRFRWKHNKLFLLLPEEYGPAFPAIVDCYTSPPT